MFTSSQRRKLCGRQAEGVGLSALRVRNGAHLAAVQRLHDGQGVAVVHIAHGVGSGWGRRHRAQVGVGSGNGRVGVVRYGLDLARRIGAVRILAILRADAPLHAVHHRGDAGVGKAGVAAGVDRGPCVRVVAPSVQLVGDVVAFWVGGRRPADRCVFPALYAVRYSDAGGRSRGLIPLNRVVAFGVRLVRYQGIRGQITKRQDADVAVVRVVVALAADRIDEADVVRVARVRGPQPPDPVGRAAGVAGIVAVCDGLRRAGAQAGADIAVEQCQK